MSYFSPNNDSGYRFLCGVYTEQVWRNNVFANLYDAIREVLVSNLFILWAGGLTIPCLAPYLMLILERALYGLVWVEVWVYLVLLVCWLCILD